MAVVRKKQDDKCLEALRDLINTGGNSSNGSSSGSGGGGGNRQCFDCGQRGPTYVNMTIGSFVCTRCSGVLRGLTPPHRVKSISMATFTAKEIEFLKSHGNDACAKTWLGLWDPKRVVPQDQRDLMIDKYERKRYYLEPASPLKALTNTASVKTTISAVNNNNNNSSSNNNNSKNNINNNQNSQNNVQLGGASNLQRTTANGLHNTNTTGVTGVTAATAPTAIIKPINHVISRPQTQFQQNQQTIKSNHMLNQENNTPKSNGHQQHQHLSDAFGLTNGVNTNNAAGNKFDSYISNSDFVADFNLANIFNGTAYKMPSATTNGTTITANSYAKVQSGKDQQANKINFFNNNNHNNNYYNQSNGNDTNLKANMNANAGTTENFADFEHAPIIYNAPGLTAATTATTNIVNDNKGDFNKYCNTNIKTITAGVTPSEDRYAALKDLDDQLRESKAAAAAAAAAASAAASIMTNNLINPCNDIYNGNNHNNNNNNNNNNNIANCNGINPFDNITPEQQQQHLQQQQQQLYNPFKNLNGTTTTATMNSNNNNNNNNNNNTTNGHLYGQMTLIPHNIAATVTSATAPSSVAAVTANGFMGTQKSQMNRNFFNYTTAPPPPITTTIKTNGYHHHHHAFTTTNNNDKMIMNYCNGGSMNFENDEYAGVGGLYNGNSTTTTAALNNFFYCPLTKRMAAAAAATTGKNPFAATNAVQSNNPFL